MMVIKETNWKYLLPLLLMEGNTATLENNYQLINKKLDQIEAVMASVVDRDNNLYRVYFEASPIPEEQRKMGFGGMV